MNLTSEAVDMIDEAHHDAESTHKETVTTVADTVAENHYDLPLSPNKCLED